MKIRALIAPTLVALGLLAAGYAGAQEKLAAWFEAQGARWWLQTEPAKAHLLDQLSGARVS